MQTARVIVVGFDYSPLSEAALHRALRMTEAVPFATLHAVTVGTRVGADVRLPDGAVMSQWAAVEAVRIHLRERVRAVPDIGARNLRVIGHVRGGEPSQAILDLAFTCNAEKIVMGAHSATDDHGGTLGQVAQRVLAQAPIGVHVETAVASAPTPAPFDPLRWAFVFGTGNRRSKGALSAHSANVGMKA
ncbi:MAG: universal stress protein [Myxococcales bacterium]|nr:universal stress protein [Myxococcales bacterium]